jgi:hypothetical protein
MGHRDHGRRNDVPTWDKVKTHFKKGQQLTVSVTVTQVIVKDLETQKCGTYLESCCASHHVLEI